MQQTTISGITCNACGYEGPSKNNNSMTFLVFVGLVCLSAFFLPLIIGALAYMVWILSRPNIKTCPQCKSTNTTEIAITVAPDKASSSTQSKEHENQG